MNRPVKLVTCIALYGFSSLLAAQNPDLVLVTEDYPPFNIVHPQTHKISGISTEKVVELMHRAGEKMTITAYPWPRAFQMGKEEANTCVFSTTRTPEREPLFKWIGPLVKHNWVVFKRADDTRTPKTLEEIRSNVIGTYHDDAVEKYLSGNGFKTDQANKDSENPRKLLYKRFDFWATGELLGLAILKEQGLSGQVLPLFHFKQTDMYLACNPGMAQSRIDHFNRLLRDMDNDGTSSGIERKYR